MKALPSRLENFEAEFVAVKHALEPHGFVLGGNWEYDHGYFDCSLDPSQKVWLRLPFKVSHGTFDADSSGSDAVIVLGTPLVLKHLYEEGLDREATPKIAGSLVDQFQEPTDKDADVEPAWIERAQQVLREAEAGIAG